MQLLCGRGVSLSFRLFFSIYANESDLRRYRRRQLCDLPQSYNGPLSAARRLIRYACILTFFQA